jgi:hypothetical protein
MSIRWFTSPRNLAATRQALDGRKISIDARCGELEVLCDEFPTSHVYIFLLCNSSFLL